jgi:HAD superfamily hydrolase (TIGR01509 family)
MKRYDSVIFDFDGTIVDGLDAIVECFNLAFSKFDITPPTREEIRKKIGLPLLDIYKDFLPLEKHYLMQKVMDVYRSLAREILPKKTRLRKGVLETISFLKNSEVKLGIATSKATDTTVKTLQHLDALMFFDFVCGIDLVNHPKPDPEQLLLAVKALGSQPGRAIMIGDTYVDVLAAKAAGIYSIALLDGYGERRLIEDAQPDLQLETLTELIASGLQFGRLLKK